jgi:hypothetical protein
VEEQTIHIDESIGQVKRIRTVLAFVPQLFHPEYQPVKPGNAPVVPGAGCYVSDRVHEISLFEQSGGSKEIGASSFASESKDSGLRHPGIRKHSLRKPGAAIEAYAAY